MTLLEHGGKTLMTTHVLHKSKANRDGHIHLGMEPDMRETFVRLDAPLPILSG